MANEIAEFNRYWTNSLGRIQLPKSKTYRLCVFNGFVDDGTGDLHDGLTLSLNVRSNKGDWRNRNYTYGSFKKLGRLFSARSQFLNTDLTCGYWSHKIERRYVKGVTDTMASAGMRLLNTIVPPRAMWENEDNALREYTNWANYFINYGESYPSFRSVMVDVIEGRRLSGAFSRNYALFNLPKIKYPVLYRTVWRAGVLKNNKLFVLPQHTAGLDFLRRSTGLDVVVIPEGAQQCE